MNLNAEFQRIERRDKKSYEVNSAKHRGKQ